ncbi:MAG: hypothetical protein BZ138_04700 [Methanosphaera sp. rholeuAM270]|nr:MAG: hypothetical protein BZ138_04700 [Methanosphaera sp. rholeuAM270]
MHKPTKREIILAVTMFISYIIYVLIMSIIMDFIGLGDTGTSTAGAVSLETLVSLIFSMMNEELIKFIPLMFFMRLFYKYSENRNVSFILSSLIVLVGFGLLHYDGNTAIYSVLLYQGFGTIFEVYGYYKTRNLLVPYLSHLLTDAFLLSLTLL